MTLWTDLAYSWWIPVVFVLGAGHLTNVCVSLYLHRSQTHRGVDLHPLVSVPMRFWLWLTTGTITKQWVACHRKHHAYADKEGDPHSPVLEGLKEILFGGYVYYLRAVSEPDMVEKYGAGTPDDWLERHIFAKHHLAGLMLLFVTDVLLFDLVPGVIVWLVQMAWSPFLGGVVNGLGHAVGYVNFKLKDASHNLLPLGVFLLGEELHNNHHADPKSAKFSARPFEFDIGWLYIKLLAAVRLARVKYARGLPDLRPQRIDS